MVTIPDKFITFMKEPIASLLGKPMYMAYTKESNTWQKQLDNLEKFPNEVSVQGSLYKRVSIQSIPGESIGGYFDFETDDSIIHLWVPFKQKCKIEKNKIK